MTWIGCDQSGLARSTEMKACLVESLIVRTRSEQELKNRGKKGSDLLRWFIREAAHLSTFHFLTPNNQNSKPEKVEIAVVLCIYIFKRRDSLKFAKRKLNYRYKETLSSASILILNIRGLMHLSKQ